ncbi:MAG: hypothetical protein Q9182_005806 [Xanthomendoza sp. 2 TL-2023]
MHILVTNDDGPPSNQSSPYIHSFVKTLQAAGHVVSVIVPHQQRSWIGKAHFAAQIVKPTYFHPGTLHGDDGTTHAKPLEDDDTGEWVLVNSTPATATQLGLFHFFQDRGPVDLVLSGPNYGRNISTVFSLSSGTIGGAMEAAVCKKRAIALSYAFFSRNHDPEIIAAASRKSVKLVEHLMSHWDDGVDLYSINVPLVEGIEEKKVMYTHLLQNSWETGSSFSEIEAKDEDEDPAEKEMVVREQEGQSKEDEGVEKKKGHQHRHFTWNPNFSDVHRSVEASEPGNDGWAVNNGLVSVTPLKASFAHVPGLKGELKLFSGNLANQPRFYACIDYEDPYTHPIIMKALSSVASPQDYTLISSMNDLPSTSSPFLQISSYESIPFQHLLNHPTTSLANSYVIRKGLIRKHYLAHTIHSYLVKNPDSELKRHVPVTVDFEVDYAEFLDEALVEAYELHEAFARNQEKEAQDREWWILKPGMSDRGQGIRLFSTEEQLHDIFDQWEADQPDSDDEDERSNPSSSDPPDSDPAEFTTAPSASHPQEQTSTAGIITSQLRHFIAQPYIPPLLLPQYGNRKFHIRTYVLCLGALRVYIYKEMLALFAQVPYRPPGTQPSNGAETDMRPHLTNTCLQSSPFPSTVHPLSTLPLSPQVIIRQITTATRILFLAATQQATTFQPLPNAFEVFGLDFLVDAEGGVWVLEVNAFPGFGMSGEGGRGVVEGLWRGVLRVVLWGDGEGLGGFFGGGGEEGEKGDMIKILDIDMGR